MHSFASATFNGTILLMSYEFVPYLLTWIPDTSLPASPSLPGDQQVPRTLFMGSNASHQVSFSPQDFPSHVISLSITFHDMLLLFL
jgi:hypothetical protein